VQTRQNDFTSLIAIAFPFPIQAGILLDRSAQVSMRWPVLARKTRFSDILQLARRLDFWCELAVFGGILALTLTFPAGGALVAGGTGRVGAGVVRQLAKAGVPLLFTHRGRPGSPALDRAQALAGELGAAGFEVVQQRMDFSEPPTIRAAITAVIERWGRLHSVISGAGYQVPFAKIADFTAEDMEAHYQGDFFGHVRLYREAISHMRSAGGGSLASCTTSANRRVIDYDGVSATAKAALESLTRQIAAEEGPHGIRCNAVGIGWVAAESLEQTREQLPPATPGPPVTPAEMVVSLTRQMIGRTRLPRFSYPEEAGALFAFLASDQASYITGQTIDFDGGMSL
jgi:NAD(P)-dependent dehydrogenase (short-subunit alcohol dehydrogenase family)